MADPHAPVAHAFGKQVCNGNHDAEVFCALAYNWFHAIDDWLDSREDGRPTMTSEQFLEMIMTHTLMMNCRFWKQHSDMLLGCIVAVHNQYADSVLWERDPKEHRRHLASVLRMSGDDLFILVAMICGGIGHMRKLSPVIRETDWLRQQNDPTDEF